LASQIARYKGQGRLAEPKFQNPRWVDGELVILNRKVLVQFCLIALSCHFESGSNSSLQFIMQMSVIEVFMFDLQYNKIGPVIGFVYWVPERPFLVLFTRLRLQE